MPPAMMICEFCKHDMRKDAYMGHVQSKHIKDLGLMLLKDYSSSNVTPMVQYAQSKNPRIMVIHSAMYEDQEYWFGLKPTFWDPRSKGYSEYVKITENIEAHYKFLEIIFSEMSFLDYCSVKKDLLFKHPDVDLLRKETNANRIIYESTITKLQAMNDVLQEEVDNYKMTVDAPHGLLHELEAQQVYMECRIQKMTADAHRDKREIEMLKTFNDEQDEQKRKKNLEEIRYWQDKSERFECQYNALLAEVTEQKEAMVARVAKHLEKEEAKKRKDEERERAKYEIEVKRTEKRLRELRRSKGAESDSD